MITANLYFIDTHNTYILLAKNVTRKEANRLMCDFMTERDYHCSYIREWRTEEGIMFDVGCWTQFFLWGYEEEKA